jgi:hypothetical protein
MRIRWLVPAVLALAWASIALAADLTKIDRTIAKEPVYTGKPKYCLLVFGPEAKTKAWLALDGDVLYVDRNCNGDLTGKEKRVEMIYRSPSLSVFQAGDVIDGKTKHTSLRLDLPEKAKGVSLAITVEGNKREYAGFVYEELVFADRPQDAPIVHFNGPPTLKFVAPQKVELKRTYLEIRAIYGAHGLGRGTFAVQELCIPIPEGVAEFPHPKAGQDPIQVKFALAPDF